MLLIRHKKKFKMFNCSLCSPKTTYFAIFANFGQLWMVVYTAVKKVIQKKLMGGGVTLTPPHPYVE